MLDTILGSPTAMRVFLHLHHYGKTYASAIAHDFEISVSQVQKQLERYERAGVLVSERLGTTRIYQYNLKNFLTRPFMELVKSFYDALPNEEKKRFLEIRRRPRKPGKKVNVSVNSKPDDNPNLRSRLLVEHPSLLYQDRFLSPNKLTKNSED